MKTKAQTAETCRVTIIDDVCGTVHEFISPQSVKDAEKNIVPVEVAQRWLAWHGDDDDDDLAVAVHKTRDSIVVRWHVTGDLDSARALMQDVLSGRWEGGLL